MSIVTAHSEPSLEGFGQGGDGEIFDGKNVAVKGRDT